MRCWMAWVCSPRCFSACPLVLSFRPFRISARRAFTAVLEAVRDSPPLLRTVPFLRRRDKVVSTHDFQLILLPPSPSGLSAVGIAAGYHHTCAITIVGGVKCWGYNGYGQLGIGSTSNQYSPVDVPGARRQILISHSVPLRPSLFFLP